jgi:hypothetical protein
MRRAIQRLQGEVGSLRAQRMTATERAVTLLDIGLELARRAGGREEPFRLRRLEFTDPRRDPAERERAAEAWLAAARAVLLPAMQARRAELRVERAGSTGGGKS